MNKTNKKRSNKQFLLVMLNYAIVFLGVLAIVVIVFWNFMDAYENSRPKIAVNEYMESLTEEHICDLSQNLIDQVDHNIQSEQQCREYMCATIDSINYAKKSRECTDTRQVYVLRSGTTVIGEFSIVAQEADWFGFTPWEVENESIDLSSLNLFGSDYEVAVPSDHKVTVNGTLLDSTYIAEDKIPYEEIEDYYEDYNLPYRVSYHVAPVMGEMDVIITDPEGNEVSFDENTDWTRYFHNCSENEVKELDEFVKKYVDRYVAFTGSRKGNRYNNHKKLMQYVLEGSDFANRLQDAIKGLQFGQSQSDRVVSIVTNHPVRLEEGRYLWDITYEVDTIGYKGTVRTTTNAKIMIVQTENGLKVESMSVY